MEINELIKALRSKTSRDNRELLDEAADVIEALWNDKRRLGARTVLMRIPHIIRSLIGWRCRRRRGVKYEHRI